MNCSDYMDRGWISIPLKYRSKEPIQAEWQKYFKPKAEDFVDRNIGIRLGKPSGNLVDIDCDWMEAREIFASVCEIFDVTTATFGRASSPTSHFLFTAEVASEKFKLPSQAGLELPKEHAQCVIEIRSTGAYTVFPPSVHPTGESIEWDRYTSPTEVAGKSLRHMVGMTAFLAVCLHFYPASGSRHDFAGAFAGTLKRAGLPLDFIHRFFDLVCVDDDEVSDRHRFIDDTMESDLTTGLPRLCEMLGLQNAAEVISNWLGSEQSELISEINQKYFGVTDGGKVRVCRIQHDPAMERDKTVSLTFTDFRHEFNRRIKTDEGMKAVADIWWGSQKRRFYEDGFVFDPSGRDYPHAFNLWRGYGIEAQAGDWSLLRQHIEMVVAPDHAEYAIKWLAWTIQNPHRLPEVAFVMRGGRGTGKGTLARWMLKIYGHHALTISGPDLLTGRFNYHLRDCCFLFADEAFWAGDRQAEGRLKALITEPMTTYEQKGRDASAGPNYVHLMVASNEDWVIPAGADERRFFVCDVSDARRGDHAYWDALHTAEAEGLPAMLKDLRLMDLGDFHPRQVPTTDGLRDQMQSSEVPERALIRRWLMAGCLPGTDEKRDPANIVLFPHAKDALQRSTFGNRVTDKRFGTAMRSIAEFSDNCGKQFIGDTGDGLPMTKRVVRYVMPPLKEARARFDPREAWPAQDDWLHELVYAAA